MRDGNTSYVETFVYDALSRLTTATLNPLSNPLIKTVSYTANGNIAARSDVGTYSYPAAGQARPHGVTSVTNAGLTTTYTYDNRGNLVSGRGLTTTYTSYNMPAAISNGAITLSFDHDSGHMRFRQTTPTGVMVYLADAASGVASEARTNAGSSNTTWTDYLVAGGSIIGMHVSGPTTPTITHYPRLRGGMLPPPSLLLAPRFCRVPTIRKLVPACSLDKIDPLVPRL